MQHKWPETIELPSRTREPTADSAAWALAGFATPAKRTTCPHFHSPGKGLRSDIGEESRKWPMTNEASSLSNHGTAFFATQLLKWVLRFWGTLTFSGSFDARASLTFALGSLRSRLRVPGLECNGSAGEAETTFCSAAFPSRVHCSVRGRVGAKMLPRLRDSAPAAPVRTTWEDFECRRL